GRGRFSFVPAKGEAYSLRITEPAGITKVFALPAVKASGVVISSTSDITPRLKDVVVRLGATSDGSYLIVLSQRGKELALKPVTPRANQPADFTLAVPKFLDGVIAVTVYNDRMSPMAERFIFRPPARQLVEGTQRWGRLPAAVAEYVIGSVTAASNPSVARVTERGINSRRVKVLTAVTNQTGVSACGKVATGACRGGAAVPGFQ